MATRAAALRATEACLVIVAWVVVRVHPRDRTLDDDELATGFTAVLEPVRIDEMRGGTRCGGASSRAFKDVFGLRG